MRRAERRGKKLPEILEKALKQQIERWRKYGSPLPVFEGEGVIAERYDARGNGDGKVVPTITGDHNGHMSDYTALLVENKAFSIDPLSSNSMKSNNPHSGFHETSIAKCLDTSDGSPNKNQGGTVIVQGYAENSSGDGISGTIDAHYYLGCGARGGKEREFVAIAIDRAAFNQGQNAKYDIGIDESGIAQTVVARGPSAVCYEIGNGQVDEAGLHSVCGALNCMHDPKAVLYPVYCPQGNGIDRADTAGCNGKGVTENVSYTLNTVDRHAVCCEAEGHTHKKVVRMREGKDGGGKGALVQEDKSGTIACNNDQVLFQKAETQYIVRRLTPLECCRLQGMPDFWTDGVEGSDAARYKLWGNGMALPNALYIMEGISETENGR